MKLSIFGMAGIGTLFGAALMSAVIAAEPGDGGRRPAFEGGRGPGPGGMRGRGEFRRGPAFERQLTRMDADDDGQVSEEEFVDFRLAPLDESFERRDQDGDGLISLDENRRPNRAGRAERGELGEDIIACARETLPDFAPEADLDFEERFENTDTDGSGSLTLSEVSAALETQAHEAFARIDADGNGFIAEEELRAQHEARLDARRELRQCARQAVQA